MSIIKHVTLEKIVAHDFRYDPRSFGTQNYQRVYKILNVLKSMGFCCDFTWIRPTRRTQTCTTRTELDARSVCRILIWRKSGRFATPLEERS